jgi:hypothetical protein
VKQAALSKSISAKLWHTYLSLNLLYHYSATLYLPHATEGLCLPQADGHAQQLVKAANAS